MKHFDAEILEELADTVSPEALGLKILDLKKLRDHLPHFLSDSVTFTDLKKLELIRIMRDLCETLLILPARFPEGFKEIPAWDLSLSSDEATQTFLQACNEAQLAPPAFLSSKDSAATLCIRVYALALKSEVRGPLFLYHPQPGPQASDMGIYNSTADWIRVVNGTEASGLEKSGWTRARVLGSTHPRV